MDPSVAGKAVDRIEAASLASRYVERLARASPLPPRVAALLGEANRVEQVHAALAGLGNGSGARAATSLAARLCLALAGARRPPVVASPSRGLCVVSTPPIRRSPMAPRPWRLRLALAAWRGATRNCPPPSRLHRTAVMRRLTLLIPLIVQAVLATYAMRHILPHHGTQPIEIALLVLFAVLNAWIGVGFWTAMAGFLLLLRGRDRHAISSTGGGDQRPLGPGARTAIVMPICNEDVARVFAGLRATYRSVERTGALEHFDFFVLSDSVDPDLRMAERAAWLDLCRSCAAFGRVFYRLRQHRIKRKSGNIADFCRRWGRNYRYMVVLDADSVMTGACLVQLMRLMEANPDAGIIQTAPRATGRETLYARIQQFGNRAYGPMFVAGMHFWQLGESHYWGHNAIIRVAPFIEHCALARLPGRGTLSGEILSHDFVEAALMRRAGWGVWTAYDLPGSFEEMPPNLLDELKRDRRWCQGNLINSRLFFAHGLHPAHRAVFATGVMAYVSAPLWFLFLVLSTIALTLYTFAGPSYIVEWHQLFRLWPQWHPARALQLCAATAGILFVPKLLAVALIAVRDAKAYGGRLRLAASALLEVMFSALLAPIRMIVHTQFVLTALSGWKVAWKSPSRADNETTWSEALRRHGWHTLVGLAWGAYVYRLNPGLVWWLVPVAGALALSIPLSVLSSRVAFGGAARRAGLFVIPEESRAPPVLRRMRRYLRMAPPLPVFADALVDPLDNALACASDMARTRSSDAMRAAQEVLAEKVLALGPDALTSDEKNALLDDAPALLQCHDAIWSRPAPADFWRSERLRGVATSARPARRHRREPTPDLANTSELQPADILQIDDSVHGLAMMPRAAVGVRRASV